jgi:hypothetical protein
LCLFAATASVVPAQDLQLWNTTEFTALQARRWKVEGFGVLRTCDHVSSAYDRRVGSLVRFSLSPGLSLAGGYMRRWTDADGAGIRGQNRFSFGPTVVWRSRPLAVEWVSLAEHHRIHGEAPFMRYKQRVEIQHTRAGWAPFFYEEIAFRREGFTRFRSLLGLRKGFHGGRRFEIGYQFETLGEATVWIPRHSIRTTLVVGSLFARHR